jgi:hypothetical protein
LFSTKLVDSEATYDSQEKPAQLPRDRWASYTYFMISLVLAARPSNPADMERLIQFATKGARVIDKANSAISQVMAGSHADVDYLADARSFLSECHDILST